MASDYAFKTIINYHQLTVLDGLFHDSNNFIGIIEGPIYNHEIVFKTYPYTGLKYGYEKAFYSDIPITYEKCHSTCHRLLIYTYQRHTHVDGTIPKFHAGIWMTGDGWDILTACEFEACQDIPTKGVNFG